ncbi:hypothetical protein D3C81_1573290 [compost metagenome]
MASSISALVGTCSPEVNSSVPLNKSLPPMDNRMIPACCKAYFTPGSSSIGKSSSVVNPLIPRLLTNLEVAPSLFIKSTVRRANPLPVSSPVPLARESPIAVTSKAPAFAACSVREGDTACLPATAEGFAISDTA